MSWCWFAEVGTSRMIPLWLIRIYRLLVGPVHHYEADVSFVSSSVSLWETFVESPALLALLSSPNNDDGQDEVANVEEWQEQLRIAFRLCRDMDLENSLDLQDIMPVLCRLIVGTYQAEQGVTCYDDNILLHALIGITMSSGCPPCIFDWVVTTFPEQLRTVHPVTEQLPLAAVCSSLYFSAERLSTILHAYPQAAVVSDSNGDYPLHLICQREHVSWQHSIHSIFLAAPQVLRIPTASDGQCLLVATAIHHSEQATARGLPSVPVNVTNTLFELLRCDPTVVREFVTG